MDRSDRLLFIFGVLALGVGGLFVMRGINTTQSLGLMFAGCGAIFHIMLFHFEWRWASR